MPDCLRKAGMLLIAREADTDKMDRRPHQTSKVRRFLPKMVLWSFIIICTQGMGFLFFDMAPFNRFACGRTGRTFDTLIHFPNLYSFTREFDNGGLQLQGTLLLY